MKKYFRLLILAFTTIIYSACKDYSKQPGTTATDSLINNTAEIADTAYLKGARLISANDCITCHAVDRRMFGPSFQEIAAKYDHQEKLAEYLANSVIKGSKGVFGENAMTPHQTIPYNDIIAMTGYILSVKPKK